MPIKTLKFNSAPEVLEHLEQEHLNQKEREYYLNKLRSSGHLQGVCFPACGNKEK